MGQLDNEQCRVAVEGRRVDDGERCTLLAIHERSGYWAIYPHGAGRLGIRLAEADAATVARAILDGAS